MDRSPFARAPVLTALKVLLIVAAGFWIYSPVFHGAWLMDDDLYVANNPLQHDPAWLSKTWFEPGQFIEYYPIEETLLGAMWRLWGNDTLPFHLATITLHVVDALLVWWLLAKLRLRLAWLGGLIFAVHPANVESVAWISEFKNTLSLAPGLLALGAWIDFEETRRPRDYALALAFFLVSMLCKITLAPFPLAVLLYAWWQRGKIGPRDVIAVVPFAAISAALTWLTLDAGVQFRMLNHTPPEAIALGGIADRLDLVGLTSGYYFTHYLLPFTLNPMIAPWTLDPGSLRQFLPWFAFLPGLLWFWSRRETWGRHALFGLGFFFLFVAPFLGFITVSFMKNTWVQDHLIYLPSLGLIGLIVAALSDLAKKITPALRPLGIAFVSALIILLAVESHSYAAIFARPSYFYSYITAQNPGWWANHDGLGNALRKEGRTDEAMAEFLVAAQLGPDQPAPLNNLGGLFLLKGRVDEAADAYRRAIALAPDDPQVRTGLGNALLVGGKFPEAITAYQDALKIRPDYAQAHNGLANALMHAGRLDEALQEADTAVQLAPHYVEALGTKGLILAQQGRIAEAIGEFEAAQVYAPNDPRIAAELETLRAQLNAPQK